MTENERDFYRRHEALRLMIEHENTLIGSRVGWMIACQALLIAALGFGTFDSIPRILICFLGFSISFVSMKNIILAQHAIAKLTRKWTENDRNIDKRFPDVIGYRGDGRGFQHDTRTPPVWIAISFMIYWTAMCSYYALVLWSEIQNFEILWLHDTRG